MVRIHPTAPPQCLGKRSENWHLVSNANQLTRGCIGYGGAAAAVRDRTKRAGRTAAGIALEPCAPSRSQKTHAPSVGKAGADHEAPGDPEPPLSAPSLLPQGSPPAAPLSGLAARHRSAPAFRSQDDGTWREARFSPKLRESGKEETGRKRPPRTLWGVRAPARPGASF